MGIINEIRQRQFSKNVSILASGTIVVQIISFLLSPVLSRLYTPEDYGLFAVFTSIISVLTVVCCLRYELAIVIPKTDEEAVSILKLCIFIISLLSLIVFILILFFKGFIAVILGNTKIENWLLLVAPVLFLTGSVQALTYWFNRKKEYKIISGSRIYQSSVNSSSSLLLGLLKLNSFGLIVSSAVSQLLPAIFLYKKSGVKVFNFKNLIPQLPGLKETSHKYREFPYFNLPGAFFDTLSVNSVIFILSNLFSETVTGSYSFAIRILSVPGIVLGASVGQVFYQKISEAYYSNEKITDLIFKSWKVLFLMSIIPSMIIFFFGEDIFRIVFGVKWTEAGTIAKYLSLLTLFTFVSSPTSSAMIILKKQKEAMVLNIFAFIYRPLSLVAGYYLGNFLYGIILYIFFEIIQILTYNFIMIRAAKKADMEFSLNKDHRDLN
ncbi:MAG: oligosaccharide flippase family protein [Bacteroidetes bacterium]|nr:oligosaccharide flippase family protein [Bacteroidota bacterium]